MVEFICTHTLPSSRAKPKDKEALLDSLDKKTQPLINKKQISKSPPIENKFSWESIKKRYANTKYDVYHTLLKLSKELEDAEINLSESKNKTELKAIIDTLPPCSVEENLNTQIVELNKVKLDKDRRQFS